MQNVPRKGWNDGPRQNLRASKQETEACDAVLPKQVTRREPSAVEYALHVLNELRKQGVWNTLLETSDQATRRISGAPTEH